MTTKILPLALAAVLLVTSCSGTTAPPAADTTTTTTTVSTAGETTVVAADAEEDYLLKKGDVYIAEELKIVELNEVAKWIYCTFITTKMKLEKSSTVPFDSSVDCTVNGTLAVKADGKIKLTLDAVGLEKDLSEFAEIYETKINELLFGRLINDVIFSIIVKEGQNKRAYVQRAEPTAENILNLYAFANISEDEDHVHDYTDYGFNLKKWGLPGMAKHGSPLAEGTLVGTSPNIVSTHF